MYGKSTPLTFHTAGRFWRKVNKNGPIPANRPDLGPCWLWTAYVNPDGYGCFQFEGGGLAHRFAYLTQRGPIPADKVIDHLCRVRHCVNPGHLEVVTQRVNLLRGESIQAHNAAKTHCKHGHQFTPENTDTRKGRRYCRQCRLDRKRSSRSLCPRGHRLAAAPACEICARRGEILRRIEAGDRYGVIAGALGKSEGALLVELTVMRKEGWRVPYRSAGCAPRLTAYDADRKQAA